MSDEQSLGGNSSLFDEANREEAREKLKSLVDITAPMMDLTAPQDVEIEIRHDGKVVWVHVEGVTKLRACRIVNLQVIDHRNEG